jgi:general secretion pathway protein A
MIAKRTGVTEGKAPGVVSSSVPPARQLSQEKADKKADILPTPPQSARTVNTPLTSETGTNEVKADAKPLDAPNVLDRLLISGAVKTDVDTAFSTLLRRWQVTYPVLPGMTACERAAKTGLRCFEGKGNWTTLRHLNRPVILELVGGDQRQHHVAAVCMEDQEITLDFGDQEVTVNQAAIEPFWFGEFTLLWKPPPLASPVIKEGDRGPDVLWLRAQLDRAQGIQAADGGQTGPTAPSPSPLFDDKLKKRVMDFQRAHFVEADGIVGEQTLIQLNRSTADSPIPFLCPLPPNGERHVVYP